MIFFETEEKESAVALAGALQQAGAAVPEPKTDGGGLWTVEAFLGDPIPDGEAELEALLTHWDSVSEGYGVVHGGYFPFEDTQPDDSSHRPS